MSASRPISANARMPSNSRPPHMSSRTTTDSHSFTSSNMADRNGGVNYDSDNSDYNYDSHYGPNRTSGAVPHASPRPPNSQPHHHMHRGGDEDGDASDADDPDESMMSFDNGSGHPAAAASSSTIERSSTVNTNANDEDSLSLSPSQGQQHQQYQGKGGGGGRKHSRAAKQSEEEQAAALLAAQQAQAIKELEEHKKRLQIYVFICRCIAYPFIAKQPTDMVRRQLKISKQQLEHIKDNFEMFLQNKMSSVEADEAFINAVRSYTEVFLKSDRVAKLVQAGGCTSFDFRDVFKNNIEKRVRSLPEIDGLSKETVLSSWMAKFDTIFRHNEEQHNNQQQLNQQQLIAHRRHSRHLNQHLSIAMASECILTKEQLYELFQQILGIKKFEHQLIFNAAQLDNGDEQAATIRRELDSRMKQTENVHKDRSLMPKFVHKNMESTYIDELKQSISLLMNHLDNQPVGAIESKLKLPKRAQGSKSSSGGGGGGSSAADAKHDDAAAADICLSKSDVVLNFAIEVVVMEVKGLKSLPPNRIVFCVMEVEGHSKLQTDQAEASRPIWDTSGDFKTQQPLPVIKVKLCMETQNILQDNKELGRVVIRPDPNYTRASTWYVMEKHNTKFPDELKIKLTVRIDKPGNLKMCG